MSEYNFTTDDVLDKVKEIGNRFPDFIYTNQEAYENGTCLYLGASKDDDGNYIGQGCIVGQALRSLGVPTSDIEEWEGLEADGLMKKLGIPDPTASSYTLLDIQERQDDGMSWGDAVK